MLDRILAKYRGEGIAGVIRAVIRRVAPTGEPKSNQALLIKSNPLDSVLEWLTRQNSISIVQIGAYIGDTEHDPLCRFLRSNFRRGAHDNHQNSTVILIEPVKDYYEQLRKNYADLDVHFENAAIAGSVGERDFYRLSVDPTAHGHPEWLAQLGSLRADRMTTLWDQCEKNEDLKKFYLAHPVSEKVRCTTLHDLLEKYRLHELDLLQIDAEGSEYEIIRTIDFNRLKPRFINYERALMQESEADCRKLLVDAGYLLVDWWDETLEITVS